MGVSRRALTLAIGLLMLMPLICVSGYELLVLRRSDIAAGIRPLVIVPIADLRPGTAVTRDVVVPSEGPWKRLRAAFGPPMLLVAAVNAPLDERTFHRTYRATELPLQISVSSQRGPVQIVPTGHSPFGYSAETDSTARSFAAEPGDRIHLRIETHDQASLAGEVVVVADWPARAMADASAAFSFIEGFRWIAFVLAFLGAVCVYAASRPGAK